VGRSIALVSGTNGKTTTTRLLAAAVAESGPLASNLLGANLPPGLASALASAPAGVPAVLEVDEAWLGKVVDATSPRAVALLNLSRDQLDRNNEVRHLSSVWRAALEGRDLTVVANADDPLVVWGAGKASKVVWVGAGQPWTSDAAGCPNCGGRVAFAGTAGGWACRGCGFARPDPHVWIDGDEMRATEWPGGQPGGRLRVSLSLPGRANRANAAMAMAVASVLGVGPERAARAMEGVGEVAGRYATRDVRGVSARLLLCKNPAGWIEVFDLLRPAPMPVVVAINARIADGKDPSWLWDVEFERLRGRFVVATGERGLDLAVRLHYAEIDHTYMPDLLDAIAAVGGSQADVVANYTSFQQIRARLG
jgi:UDP-N-acetylmuramyl tripeptide synthase